MRFIDVKAFLQREKLMEKRKNVDPRTQVFSEFRDAENTRYAFLSHRWIASDVNYQEMVNLGKMDTTEQDEIRGRLGYTKLLRACIQANIDGCELLWVDSCCIDRPNGVELSEASNAAYRWCENSERCYVHLHDVDGPFPAERDKTKYPNSDGWPEWFSRAWTLQEMIAPRLVLFFNRHWKLIGDKHEFAATLQDITQVPKRVLTDGLSRNRPCVAQIISWGANRRAGRLEDRAYSLMGLLDVNMPLLYGEGKKAFHRLQLEIIRASNDPSIFAWGWHGESVRTGSILADDPSFFRHCSEMEIMGYDEFILQLKASFPDEEFRSVDESHFGTSAITNRGIHTWMFLRPYVDSGSVFKAWLPCRNGSRGPPVTINLAVQNYNYYRYLLPLDELPTALSLQFRQLYLSYRMDTYHDVKFEFNDTAMAENGFTCCATYPPDSRNQGASTLTTLSITDTAPLCVKTYTDTQGNGRFSVAFGQFFGLDWVRLVNIPPNKRFPSLDEAKLLVNGAKHAYFMAEAPSRGDPRGRIWVYHSRLPQSNWTLRISRMVWEKSRIGVRVDVFRDFSLHDGLDEWRNIDVEKICSPFRDMRGLALYYPPCKAEYILSVNEFRMEFSLAPEGTRLGDYGRFTDAGHFNRTGNIFTDIESRIPETNIELREENVTARMSDGIMVVANTCLSLSDNCAFLTSFSSRLDDAYLVTRVVQCAPKSDALRSRTTKTLCTIRKPFVWHEDPEWYSRMRIPG